MSTEQRVYQVTGMSCDHCKAAVTEEVAQVEGIEAVDVDVEAATLTVSGEKVDDAAIRGAVEEAGYEVVS